MLSAWEMEQKAQPHPLGSRGKIKQLVEPQPRQSCEEGTPEGVVGSQQGMAGVWGVVEIARGKTRKEVMPESRLHKMGWRGDLGRQDNMRKIQCQESLADLGNKRRCRGRAGEWDGRVPDHGGPYRSH